MLTHRIMTRLALAGGVLLATRVAEAQNTWYVDDNGAAAAGCSSWADACPELQSALSVAGPGDQVWVATGIYKPDYDVDTNQHTGDREATFQLINGVAVYGGFDATEKTLEERAGLRELSVDADSLRTIQAGAADDVPEGPGALPVRLADAEAKLCARNSGVQHPAVDADVDPGQVGFAKASVAVLGEPGAKSPVGQIGLEEAPDFFPFADKGPAGPDVVVRELLGVMAP